MKRRLPNPMFTLATVLALVSIETRAGENGSTPGEVFQEIPTLHCLGVRWPITGDANENAAIEVRYRPAGGSDYKTGYPLFRTKPNPHPENRSGVHTVANGWMFAGSIFGLTPDTEYEVVLHLKDPDGGDAEKALKMKTWKAPELPAGMSEKHVAPGNGGGTGTKEDPFKGLKTALEAAAPGTVLLLHAGTYLKDDGLNGTLVIGKDGLAGKPIVFRAAGDGEVILEGGGNAETGGSVILAQGRKHLWFEGLTLRGKHYAINANGASHFVIRRCKFRDVSKGFNAQNGGYTGSQHFYITDNDYVGPTTWPRTKGIESYCFTYMSGAGHVVAYNKMYNAGDGMHGTGHGSWSACDIYNNDLNICTDDGLETDHCEFNIRVWNNRIRNVAHGITAQPSRGGPVYIFRNVIYSATYSPFKLHNHTTGVLIFHNTCFKQSNAFNIVPADETVSNIVTRNNLFLTSGGTGLSVGTPNMRMCDFDSDGYGGCGTFARWNAKFTYKTIADAKAGGLIYHKIGAYPIDPKTCFEKGTLPPADEKKEYSIEEIDFRLAEKSDAIDKGVVLPNFNDGCKGKAPDLGALEYGDPMPHYGPRPDPTK